MSAVFCVGACTVRRAVALVVCVLGLTSSAGADDIRGDCRYGGELVRFSDGVVYREANSFDESRDVFVVALTTFVIDKNVLAATKQKSDEIIHQQFASRGGYLLKLHLAGGRVAALSFSGGGEDFSIAARSFGKLQMRADDATHVDAGYALDSDPDGLHCRLDFDLAYATRVAVSTRGGAAKPAPKGKALPPGGGEPGKVFQANLAAMRSGDVDAMLATVTQAQAAKMRAQKNDPDFAAMLAMMKALAPKSANVTAGQDFGDSAELVIDAIDSSGAKATGTSTLRKEGGQWKVDRTSMKSGQ